jgi:hypothetical protein
MNGFKAINERGASALTKQTARHSGLINGAKADFERNFNKTEPHLAINWVV